MTKKEVSTFYRNTALLALIVVHLIHNLAFTGQAFPAFAGWPSHFGTPLGVFVRQNLTVGYLVWVGVVLSQPCVLATWHFCGQSTKSFWGFSRLLFISLVFAISIVARYSFGRVLGLDDIFVILFPVSQFVTVYVLCSLFQKEQASEVSFKSKNWSFRFSFIELLEIQTGGILILGSIVVLAKSTEYSTLSMNVCIRMIVMAVSVGILTIPEILIIRMLKEGRLRLNLIWPVFLSQFGFVFFVTWCGCFYKLIYASLLMVVLISFHVSAVINILIIYPLVDPSPD